MRWIVAVLQTRLVVAVLLVSGPGPAGPTSAAHALGPGVQPLDDWDAPQWLATNAGRPGVVTLLSGVQYRTVIAAAADGEGEGAGVRRDATCLLLLRACHADMIRRRAGAGRAGAVVPLPHPR